MLTGHVTVGGQPDPEVLDASTALYAQAFGVAPYFESPEDAEASRSRALGYLQDRDGGRLAWVEDGATGRQVAMALGVIGTPGTWWRDRVAEFLADQDRVDRVLGDAVFEVVHVATGSDVRRRGYGRFVLELLLSGVPVSSAVLSCDPRAEAACQLYRSAGWTLITDEFRLPGQRHRQWLMTKQLRSTT